MLLDKYRLRRKIIFDTLGKADYMAGKADYMAGYMAGKEELVDVTSYQSELTSEATPIVPQKGYAGAGVKKKC